MKYQIFLILSILTLSCSTTQVEVDEKQEITESPTPISTNEVVLEITQEQQSAFDALNTLQINTDEKNHLYSTFAGIVQPCYPADTSLTISRSNLLIAMNEFVAKHCKYLPVEKREKLASKAVLAQEEYVVLHCSDNSNTMNYENGLPMTGTWVMPNVLGRRDVIIVW